MAKEYNHDMVTGVENISGKKSGAKIAGITAGALAVAAIGGGSAAYCLSDYVKNQVNLRVMKPQSYYAWVNEENSKETAEKVADRYKQYIENVKSGQTISGNFTFDISEDCKSMLEDELAYGNDEFVDVIKKTDSLNFNITSATKKDCNNTTASFGINGSDIVSLEYVLDMGAMDFFRIPELTDKWLTISTEDFTEELSSDESKNAANAYKEFMKDPEAFLSPEEVQDIVERYMGIWNKSIEDVSKENKESVDICDITVEYTALTVELSPEKQDEIYENICNELKNDEIIKGLVVDKMGICTEEEYAEKIDEGMEEKGSSDTAATLVTYVDPKGEIRGMSFETEDSETMRFICGKDDDQVRGEFIVINEGEKNSIKLTATENDKKYTGNVEIISDDETTTIDFSDFEIVNDETLFFNADLTVNPADEKSFSVKCTSDGSTQTVSSDIEVEGVNYGKLSVNLSFDKSASPEIPSKDDAFELDSDTNELTDYVSQDEVNKFINDIMIKIGFSEKTAKETASSTSGLLYGDYSSLYSSSDYSDFNNYLDGYDDSDYEFDFDSYDFDSADFDFSDLDLEGTDFENFTF